MSALVVLRGDARARGRGQAAACPDMAPAVQDAIHSRLAAAPDTTLLVTQTSDPHRLALERGGTVTLSIGSDAIAVVEAP